MANGPVKKQFFLAIPYKVTALTLRIAGNGRECDGTFSAIWRLRFLLPLRPAYGLLALVGCGQNLVEFGAAT